ALSAASARADPINIRGGFLDMGPNSGPLSLGGDRGFTFASSVDVTGGFFLPSLNCNFDPVHCRPGDTLNLGASWIDNDVTGTATLDGVIYPNVGSLGSFSSMAVQFSGTAVLPPLAGGTMALTAPFLFHGTFFHPVDNNPAGFPTTTELLTGTGTATLTLTPAPGFPGSW